MRPLDYPLLADENIHPGVVEHLKSLTKDIRTVREEVLLGANDSDVLRRAFEQGRVVLTHDSDFGKLALYANQPCVGIVYLRPGHLSSIFVVQMLSAIESTAIEADPPFLVTAERRDDAVRIRSRSASS
jgi:predicted nuclease of predicted toxin-antitoxin system